MAYFYFAGNVDPLSDI